MTWIEEQSVVGIEPRTSVGAEPLLFSVPSVASVVHPLKRGRGATPCIERTWTASRPNPSGRRTLVFRFRPLKRHEAMTVDGRVRKRFWEVACNLIAEHFAQVGGFRLADDAVVTAWADCLADHSPAEIRAAIAAKAKSLTGAIDAEDRRHKLCLRGQAATFPARLDYWLDLSEHASHRRPVVDDGLRGQLDKIDRPFTATPAPQPGPGPARDRRTLLAEHLDVARRHENANRAQLARLSERQRALAARAVGADFGEYVAAFDATADPDDERFEPLCLEQQVRAATLRWGRGGAHDSAIGFRHSGAGLAIAAPLEFLEKQPVGVEVT